ncbi:MAG: hypothetical protein PWP08_1230 [Methanofollis sp.]|nr:hypothetical protein [Methanofollis sp.]
MQHIKDQIRDSWDRSSAYYDTRPSHGISSDEERYAWALEFSSLVPEKACDVLDVGCGTGEISLVFADMNHRVTGIDLSGGMLSKAVAKAQEKGYPIDFRTGDAEDLPFEDESFDVVVERHLLWTLPEGRRALGEWRRVLRKGGRVIVIDGLWNDGSFSTRCRHSIASGLTALFEGQDRTEAAYTSDMNASLPDAGGLPADAAEAYLRDAGFTEVGSKDLSSIRRLQTKNMPWYQRIAYNWNYYLASGKK